jgi:gamma-glutamyltranspeptidase
MKKGGNAFDAMVATELALVATLRRKPWWWWIYGL